MKYKFLRPILSEIRQGNGRRAKALFDAAPPMPWRISIKLRERIAECCRLQDCLEQIWRD
jgi:hypothetical protein